jgi:Flp pilus assembly protein TadD
METTAKMVRLLAQAGFLAANTGQVRRAMQIFDGVQAARPESNVPSIGCSVAMLYAGMIDEAVCMLKAAAKRDPADGFVGCYLGMSLLLSGEKAEAGAVLKNIVAKKQNAVAVALANKLLAT